MPKGLVRKTTSYSYMIKRLGYDMRWKVFCDNFCILGIKIVINHSCNSTRPNFFISFSALPFLLYFEGLFWYLYCFIYLSSVFWFFLFSNMNKYICVIYISDLLGWVFSCCSEIYISRWWNSRDDKPPQKTSSTCTLCADAFATNPENQLLRRFL